MPFPRNPRFRARILLWATQLLTLQAGQFDGGGDPLIDQLTQPRIGAQLLPHADEFRLPDELAAAAAVPGVAQLVIRAVALSRIVLAPAAGGAAHVVLAAERARPQGTERRERGLECVDTVVQDALRIVRHAGDCSAARRPGHA